MNEDDNISEKVLSEKSNVENQSYLKRNIEEPPSIISLFFDQLNFKGLLKKIFEKTPIEVTDSFIDATLLFAFLAILLYPLGVLKFELSIYTVLLFAIGLGAILEFIGINTSYLKRFFGTDMRTQIILEKIPSMTKSEIEENIKVLNFSSKCMNLFLQSLEKNQSNYPSFIIDLVIETQVLRKENLDLLLSPKLCENIRPDMMIKVLLKYRDFLTSDNIQNIYDNYKNNNDVIKILVATQKDSYFLIQKPFGNDDSENSIDSNFFEFYKTYQKEGKHLDWILNIIPASKFPDIYNSLFLVSLLGFFALSGLSVALGNITLQDPEDFVAIFFTPLFLTGIVMGFIIKPIMLKVKKFYNNRFIHNIIKK